MLRSLVLLLLLLNLGYFAWSEGFLPLPGLSPTPHTEPLRLQRQLSPQAIAVLSESEAAAVVAQAAASAPVPKVCLEAGLFDESQAQALRAVLQTGLPSGSWSLEPVTLPARWIVYMGRFDDAAALGKKRDELHAMNVQFEALHNATLEPGLSLGSASNQAAANQLLNQLAARGVRTAKVLQEQPEGKGQLLRLAQVDDALKAQLEALKAPLAGRTLGPCTPH